MASVTLALVEYDGELEFAVAVARHVHVTVYVSAAPKSSFEVATRVQNAADAARACGASMRLCSVSVPDGWSRGWVASVWPGHDSLELGSEPPVWPPAWAPARRALQSPVRQIYAPATFAPATFAPATFAPATFAPAAFAPAAFAPAAPAPAPAPAAPAASDALARAVHLCLSAGAAPRPRPITIRGRRRLLNHLRSALNDRTTPDETLLAAAATAAGPE